MKKFFSIIQPRYKFEIFDITAIITILNVVFIIFGFWWAPVLGIINCIIFFIFNTKNHAHINNWITQIALVILNIYFLTL